LRCARLLALRRASLDGRSSAWPRAPRRPRQRRCGPKPAPLKSAGGLLRSAHPAGRSSSATVRPICAAQGRRALYRCAGRGGDADGRCVRAFTHSIDFPVCARHSHACLHARTARTHARARAHTSARAGTLACTHARVRARTHVRRRVLCSWYISRWKVYALLGAASTAPLWAAPRHPPHFAHSPQPETRDPR
jgi:hypothetical protein